MKSLTLVPGKVGPLPAYLNYLFLRFPGDLGPEEKIVLECFDTYDRRWCRQGQVWVRRDNGLELVVPPSIESLGVDPSAFGLQVPVLLSKVTILLRSLSFPMGEGSPVQGQLLKVGSASYLVLRGEERKGFGALESALLADGLLSVPPGGGWWVRDRLPGFVGPQEAPQPSPETPAAPSLLERLRDGLRVARQYEEGVRKDVDTECLHQYRVHLRRVRSLASLGLMWEVVPEWTRLKNVLRQLQQRTNELRDLDVLLLDLPAHRSALPWGEGARLDSWEASLRRRRKAQVRLVKTWFESEEHRQAHEELGRLLEDLGRYGEPWTVADLTVSAFARSTQGLKKSLKRVTGDSPDEDLHQVRIRTKRLRYVLDGLGFMGSRAAKVLTVLLKRSQEGLGQFQNRSILLDRLKAELNEVRVRGAAIDLPAFGILIGTLAADHGRQKSRALNDVRRLRSKPFLKAMVQLNAGGSQAGDAEALD